MFLELYCLALVVYHECRSCVTEEQVAVAHVVMNRIHDEKEFKHLETPCQVMTQPRHFSFWWDGTSLVPKESSAWETSKNIAELVAGEVLPDPTEGALYFNQGENNRGWVHRFK